MRISPNDAILLITISLITVVVFHTIFATVWDEIEYQIALRKRNKRNDRHE